MAALLLFQASTAFENEFVQVFRNAAPCASAGPTCAERIIVALGSVDFNGKKLSRGDLQVFGKGEKYVAPRGGDSLEVVMRPPRPGSTNRLFMSRRTSGRTPMRNIVIELKP